MTAVKLEALGRCEVFVGEEKLCFKHVWFKLLAEHPSGNSLHTARNIGLERKCEVVSERAIGRMTFGQTGGNVPLRLSASTERGFLLRRRTLVLHFSAPFLCSPQTLEPSTVVLQASNP